MALLCFSFILVSCGFSSAGTGVLLWSTDEAAVPSGSVVTVRNESKLTGTYTVSVSGRRERIDLPMWRVKVFKSKKEALAYAETLKPFKATLAVAGRDGLPLREKPDSESSRVYRLKENQMLKVLEKSGEKSAEGAYSDYWYLVLTDDGGQGWAFGHTLKIMDGGADVSVQSAGVMDKNLDTFLSKTWRPEYFRTLIDDDTVDLVRFKKDYGLFIEPEAMKVNLVSKKKNLTFQYEGIDKAVGNMYIFKGTSLQVNLVTDDRISIQYIANDKTVSEVYVSLEEDIDEIIAKEQQRRGVLFKQILSKGGKFVSSAFGAITLNDKGEFTWEDFNLLVPDIIPAGVSGGGTAALDVLIPKELRESYAGGISFFFKGAKDTVQFLYTVTPEGLKLVSLPRELVEDNIVKQAPPFPIVIALSGQ